MRRPLIINDLYTAGERMHLSSARLEPGFVVQCFGPGDLRRMDSGTRKQEIIFASGTSLMIFYILGGEFTLGFNGEEYSFRSPACFFLEPQAQASISCSRWGAAAGYALHLSGDFLETLPFSMSSFSGPAILERVAPVWKIPADKARFYATFYELLFQTASDAGRPRMARQQAAYITVALLYQTMQFVLNQLELTPQENHPSGRKQAHAYVREFLRLVHTHFASERALSFYASQLCVTPKYLSQLVKASTGRTAARWIDDYVIMEAKNLLRYSGKNVQQVAYALNFPNQSAFGKYFKHLTGISPSDFQKGNSKSVTDYSTEKY